MTDLLFDPPWYLLIGLAMAGTVLIFNGLSRQAAGVKWAGVATLVAAVALFLLGRLIETGAERVTRETNEIVSAADRRDWKAFSALLDPKASFASYGGRDQLTRGAMKTMDSVGIHNVAISGIEARPEPGGYTVTFTATADVAAMPQRAPTNWKFLWVKDRTSDNYLLLTITPLPSQQFGTEPVIERLAKP